MNEARNIKRTMKQIKISFVVCGLAGTRTRNARTRPNVHAQRQQLFLLQIMTFCYASIAKT